MIVLDGNKVAEATKIQLKNTTDSILSSGNRPPGLAAVLVGNNPASETYVKHKEKDCHQVGFYSEVIHCESTITENDLLKIVDQLNQNPKIDGIIVQLPLPPHIREEKIIEAILPIKDVDGFHPINLGKMTRGLEAHLPATPSGILELLNYYQIQTTGKHAVVIGRSAIVGSPVSILLSRNTNPGNCTVTLCHSKTINLQTFTQQADILIVAAGKPHMINKTNIKPGATVIDVGIHRVPDANSRSGFRLIGDVDPTGMEEVCHAFSPVPGGVGPMTRLMLLKNTLQAYTWQQSKNK